MVLLASFSSAASDGDRPYRIAVLQRAGEPPQFVAPLRRQSVDLSPVTYNDLLADDSRLDGFECLLLPCSPDIPRSAHPALKRLIEGGRDLILLGGPAFSRPLWQFDDQWLTRDQLRARVRQSLTDSQPLIASDSPADHWKRHALDLKPPSRIICDNQQFTVEIQYIDLWAWDTFAHPIRSGISEDHNAIIFELKASPQTKNIVIEIIETDKSRWMYVAPTTTQWEKHVVAVDDFTFFSDGSPPDRGYAGDRVKLSDAKTISIGLAFGISPFAAGDHEISVRRIAAARMDSPAGFGDNVGQLDLPIFGDRDIYRLSHITDICTNREQDLLADIPDTHGDFAGTSAIGFAYPDASHFVPLLSAMDRHGRVQGWAAGMLVHYDGPYAPGHWFISGVETACFYESETFAATLRQVVDHLKNDRLPVRYQQQNRISKSRYPQLDDESATRPQRQPLRIDSTGRHFITADNQRFFAIGCNYLGPSDRKCRLGGPLFDPVKVEADFRTAHQAGVNLFRFWISGVPDNPLNFQTILTLAEQYNIYLLLLPLPHPKPTDRETLAAFAACVRLAADSPMVIGYDLMNEPQITEVGSVRINNQPSPIIAHNTYDRYAPSLTNRLWVDQLAQNRSGWPPLAPWTNDNDARELLAAHFLYERLMQEQLTCGNASLLCGLEGDVNLPEEYVPFQQALNQTIQRWIDLQADAVRSIAPHQYLTVGYNTPLVALSANQSLDFQAYHLYNVPYSRANFEQSLSTLDRLRRMFPQQPITLGEFGYSAGRKLPDGDYLDIHSAAVAEMITLLYAFANDYSGVTFWLLTEWPIANIKYNAPWLTEEKHITESRMGLHYLDGTGQGRPKPIAHATAFFREYLDTQPSGRCRFNLTDAAIPINTGYVFQGPETLFIGDQEYRDEAISFQASHPANVMLTWDSRSLRVMASTDASVTLNPKFLTRRSVRRPLTVTGRMADLCDRGEETSIGLLAGETVTILLSEIE